MKNKRKRYFSIAAMIILISVMIAVGTTIKQNRLNNKREEMRNQAYIAYVLLNDRVILSTDKSQLEEITAEDIINDYAVGTSSADAAENIYIKAEIKTENEDWFISSFCFYDEDIKTAFVYDVEESIMDVRPVSKYPEYVIEKSEIIVN